MNATATLLSPARSRRSRRALAAGVLGALLLGLFWMHTLGLHGSAAGHALPAAHHAGAAVPGEHHPAAQAAPDAGQPAASAQLTASDGSAAVMACVAILLLTALLSLPRVQPTQQRAARRPWSEHSARVAAHVLPRTPIFQLLCVSRT